MAMIEKGMYIQSISAVIAAAKSAGLLPSAVALGPNQYTEVKLELSEAQIQGKKVNANKGSIAGIVIMLSPTNGIDILFSTDNHERLIENQEKQNEEQA